jgi:hypothetical protein
MGSGLKIENKTAMVRKEGFHVRLPKNRLLFQVRRDFHVCGDSSFGLLLSRIGSAAFIENFISDYWRGQGNGEKRGEKAPPGYPDRKFPFAGGVNYRMKMN